MSRPGETGQQLNGPGTLLYRCRLCAEVHGPTGVPSVLKALIEIQVAGVAGDPRRGITAGVLGVHNCSDGRLGVSDIIGGQIR